MESSASPLDVSMRIGLCGPVAIPALARWLEPQAPGSPARPPGFGGQPVTQLAAALLDRGHQVVIATLDPTVEGECLLEGPRLRIAVGHYRHRHRARDAFRAERAHVAGVLRREQPDVVHAHWTYEFALGALATGLPTLVTVRDWAPAILRWHPHPYRAVRLLMNIVTLRKGRYFTATSPYIRDRLRRFGVRNIALIPNALPDERFRCREPTYNRAAPELIAMNNGFTRWKNVTALLRAFPLVRRRLPRATLRLVGSDFEHDGPAHRWALEHRLDAGVLFDGQVDNRETITLLRSADLFVHPSLEESFGLVLVEAMSTGLPVVGGRRSGAVPWVLGQGSAGVLADVTCPRSIATAALSVLESPQRWQQYSVGGFERARTEYRLSKVVSDYLACYDSVLQGGMGGSPDDRAMWRRRP